jgi:hypothetical protein
MFTVAAFFFLIEMFFVQGEYAVQAYQELDWSSYVGYFHFAVMMSIICLLFLPFYYAVQKLRKVVGQPAF